MFCKTSAQRSALAAGGRDEIRFESRKNLKPEKHLKMATNPTSRLHALLGNLYERKTRNLKTRTAAKMTRFYTQCLDRLDNRFDFDQSQKNTTYQNADQAKPTLIKRNADF